MTQRKGFTLVEIMIVVAIIALLAAIAIPSFMKSRQDSRRTACVNNLRLIDHAKQQEIDAKRWQEWLAFAPLGSLVSSMGGGKPVSYEDFLKRTPTKKEVDETVINDIKKHFNLLD